MRLSERKAAWLGAGLLGASLLMATVTRADAGNPPAAPTEGGTCTAQALDEQQPGGRVGERCVPNLNCVDACSTAYGEALAVSPQQSALNEENCAGDRACLDQRAANIKVAQERAMETLVYCLSLCWKHRNPGTCYQDTDCPGDGPCRTGSCEYGKCTTQRFYDGTPCKDPNKGALCLNGACVDPDTYLLDCGDRLVATDGNRTLYAAEVGKCRATKRCESLRRLVATHHGARGQATIECVEAALDAGALKGTRP